MDKLLDKWHSYQPREQMMLMLLGLAMVVFIILMLVVVPLQNWRESEAQRLTNSTNELNRVRELVAQIKAKEAKPARNANQQSLAVVIDNSLRKNDLIMRGFQPGSNQDARLRLENAAYPDLAQWLYDLEYEHGINIQELSLTPARVSGRLMVNLRVSR